MDDRAVLEVDRLQVPAHPRANLDRVDGVETRRVLVPLGDLPRDRLDDLHLRRWRRRGGPSAARREDEHGGQKCPPRHGHIDLPARSRHLIWPRGPFTAPAVGDVSIRH